jgi:hypothetical protein
VHEFLIFIFLPSVNLSLKLLPLEFIQKSMVRFVAAQQFVASIVEASGFGGPEYGVSACYSTAHFNWRRSQAGNFSTKMAKCFGILHPFFYFITRSLPLRIESNRLLLTNQEHKDILIINMYVFIRDQRERERERDFKAKRVQLWQNPTTNKQRQSNLALIYTSEAQQETS